MSRQQRRYVRVPTPPVQLQRPDGSKFDLRGEAGQGALILFFPHELTTGEIERVRSLLTAASLPTYQVSGTASGVGDGQAKLLADPDGSASSALGCDEAPAVVLVGADGYLAGGPAVGETEIAELAHDIRSQLTGEAKSSDETLGGARSGAVVGVFSPTFNRPDLARSLVLQLNNQSRRPDHLVLHQNGQAESYAWAIADIDTDIELAWIHTTETIPQDQWYEIPIRALLAHGCDVFFWCDHDDIYFANHIENGLRMLDQGVDFSINDNCGLLMLDTPNFRFSPAEGFTAHDPGGHSSSMCFTRAFAEVLVEDLAANRGRHGYSDQVLSRVTMPKFRTQVSSQSLTTAYVCHPGALSSSHWLRGGAEQLN